MSNSVPRTFMYVADPTTGQWLPFSGGPLAVTPVPIIPAAAHTTTVTGADISNTNARGGHFIINVTAFTAGANLTPKIQGKDTINSVYYDLLVGVPILATGTTVLKIGPGFVGSPNISAADFLPKTFRFVMTVTNANSVTYSVGFNPLV